VKQMGVAGEDGGYDLRLVGAVGDSGHRLSLLHRQSLERYCLHYVRTATGRLVTRNWKVDFFCGTGSGLVVAFCGEDFRENGRRNMVF
jgi:hypothetical protein